MHALVQEAKRDRDLGRIPASNEYKTRLQERIRRKKPEDGEEMKWSEDAGDEMEWGLRGNTRNVSGSEEMLVATISLPMS